MKGDNLVKKYFFSFLCVMFLSLFAALPVSASGSSSSNVPENANFSGVNFNWHSGGSPLAPAQSAGSHYCIIWQSSTTWYFGDTEHIYYWSLNDNVTSIRLNISNGGCTGIYSVPQSASGGTFRRTLAFSYSSSSDYVISSDSENSPPYLTYDSRNPTRVCVLSDLPCYDQNGNEIGSRSPLQDFSMSYFMDGSGVYHYVVGTPSTIAGNNSYSVDWFVFDGSYSFPVTVENDTLVKHTLTETYCNTYLRKFTQFYSLWEKTAFGYTGLANIINPATNYYIVPEKRISYHTNVIDNAFSPSNIGSIYRYVNGDVLTTHNSVSEYSFDAQNFLKTRGGSDFYSSSDIAICVVIHDNTNNQYILLVHKFNINDCLSAINSINHANDNSNVTAPDPTNISDWQSLAEYLKNLQNNTTFNNYINNNNLVDNITSFPWGSVINGGVGGALNEFPWSNVIGGGVGSALDDFLPTLSSEFDTVFTGLFNSFSVPTQEQLDDIEDEIAAEQEELHDKLSFVDDVKTEIYFLSSSIAAAGSGEPVFQYDVISLDVINNHVVVSDTHKQATLFRGNWFDVTTRERIKDVITVFASLSVLLYIWRTLPATIGNMPTGKGD